MLCLYLNSPKTIFKNKISKALICLFSSVILEQKKLKNTVVGREDGQMQCKSIRFNTSQGYILLFCISNFWLRLISMPYSNLMS